MRVVVYHSGYGCDTGCCGHVVRLDGKERFSFDHPGEGDDFVEFARCLVVKEFGEEHVKDLDWDNCEIGVEHD